MNSSSAERKAPARLEGAEPGARFRSQSESYNTKPIFQAETLERLRAGLSDYLAARGVELRKNGTRLKALCPVHQDKNPSFAVYGSHHDHCGCHPCGFSGDVFNLSQWLGYSSTFPEAVKDVATVLGVYLPTESTGAGREPVARPQRPAKPPEPPFSITADQAARIYAAQLLFSDEFWSEGPIMDRIGESLGLTRDTLRLVAWGSSGLGLASPFPGWPLWLCYRYPMGLKWRNPDATANGKPRFMWPVGKALAPWRWEWVEPSTRTVYLTEGESDAMALIQAGAEQDGKSVCVAIPGKELPEEWGPMFKGLTVVLCFDTDGKSDEARDKAIRIVKRHAASVKIVQKWKGGTEQ